MINRHAIVVVVALVLSLGGGVVRAAPPVPESDSTPIPEVTPPRLSLIEGTASFWRPGAEDWTPAQVNTALAAGDRLYTNGDANLELEVGARAFVRAGENTQIGIANLEPDFLQLEITTGQASIDVRSLEAGHTIEVGTPNAAFTIENTGYYRVNVNGETSTFITRRSGRAMVTLEGGRPAAISPSEQVVVQGQSNTTVETYVAPDLDEWDRWNYARTDRLLDSMSARYVSPGVAGTADLDHYGRWRVVPTYGPVWFPTAVAPGWAPYSTGRWVMDPYYGWTWIDYAPWGWAPYHYGRWVHLDSAWAWAPGPLLVRTAYAPALVVFFGGDDFSLGFQFGGPAIGWFALSWGEPCYPWWGPHRYRYNPWWGGWGGPHDHWHHHDRHHLGDYRNAHVHRAVSGEREDHFGGHGDGDHRRRIDRFDPSDIEPYRGKLPVRATPASLAPGSGGTKRPPAATENRPVVGTRASRDPSKGLREAGIPVPAKPRTLPTRVVPSLPKRAEGSDTPQLPRPPFGTRGGSERPEPPEPPPYRGTGGTRSESGYKSPSPRVGRGSSSTPSVRPAPAPARVPTAPTSRGASGGHFSSERSRTSVGTAPAPRAVQQPHTTTLPSRGALPGEPANRVFGGWGKKK
jgi:hypothetical protein